ncbi:MAG TPA: hypothetical protein VFE58_03580 [Tepidisphaeraceae bacterium]|nr:hypothetical protein [Tepidisphaeraceae bacterium]
MAATTRPDFPTPILHAHAHNDYRHKRPLFDALDHGFTSVEADIHIIKNQILVAHDRHEAETEVDSPARTLQTLYLDPLLKRAQANNGRIYPDVPSIYLLIDMKASPADVAYKFLTQTLKQYEPMLTTWDSVGRHTRAVTVIISGNHTHSIVAAAGDPIRYAASDGTLPDLNHPELSPELVPWISSDWKKTFTWNGKGSIPDDQRTLLRQIVEKTHQQHRLLRFWDAPDNENTWKELRADGVDLINTDNLAGVQAFLLSSPNP